MRRLLLVLLLLCIPLLADRTVDEQGKVSTGDAGLDLLFGPMLEFGHANNPWPYFDDTHEVFADFFGALQATDYIDYWNTPQAGTVSIAQSGTAVTGSGTSLQTVFCDGGSTPNGKKITLWYVVGAGTGRHSYNVGSCTDETHITLAGGTWGTMEEASQTNIQFSTETEAQQGQWVNPSTNANYYDNVMAFYSLYYRTGLTVYRDYARTLADRWWTHPNMDQGRVWDQSRRPQPRLLGVTGLVARAVDGRPEMWPGIRLLADTAAASQVNPGDLADIREEGYQISHLALEALLDPDSGERTHYLGHLEEALTNRWGPDQQANGQWYAYGWGPSPPNGNPGTATTTNGSATVTGQGTNWSNQMCGSDYNWAWFNDSTDMHKDSGDAEYYPCTWVSATEVTLGRDYEGVTGSGKGWEFYFLAGWGTQPFMMGIVGSAMNWSYLALDAGASELAPTVRQYILDAADWIKDYGYSSTARSLYYARDFINCEPIEDETPGCGATGDAASRFLNSEAMNVISQAYALTGAEVYKTTGDNMFSAMWAHSEDEPGYDGVDVGDEMDYALSVKKAKNFGFVWGIGMGSSWPAARLGSEEEPAPGVGISGSVIRAGSFSTHQ